ncbi:MAG: hypothetical protein PVG49_13350 [Desulfobacteraceae bacterium]|jgi:hypothetical protein
MENEINENEVLKGHPAQEPDEPEPEGGDERAFQTLEEYDSAFEDLAQQEMSAAEREAEILAEAEELQAREKAEKEFRQTAREIRKKHLERTGEIDPDEPGFDDSVATAWADSDVEVQSARERIFKDTSKPSKAASIRWAEGYRDAEAIRNGINPEDTDFQKICAETPVSGSFQDQVAHAVKTYHKTHRKKDQRPTEQPTINSIEDALQESEGSRRLEWEDLQERRNTR